MRMNNQIPRRKFVKTTAKAMAIFPVLPMLSTSNPSKNALKLAQEHREELIDLLEKLIQVQSIQRHQRTRGQLFCCCEARSGYKRNSKRQIARRI